MHKDDSGAKFPSECDGITNLPWQEKRAWLKALRAEYAEKGEVCVDVDVQRKIRGLSTDSKWEVRLEAVRFLRYLPSEVADPLVIRLSADGNRNVADAARKCHEERKKVERDADRVTEFFLTRTAQTREAASPEEKINLADTLTRLTRQGIAVLGAPAKGVSLHRTALLLNEDDEVAAREAVKRWRNQRGVPKPAVLGTGVHGRELHLPEDVVEYVCRADPGLIKDRGEFIGYLRGATESPRT